jgi:hypothetical protein
VETLLKPAFFTEERFFSCLNEQACLRQKKRPRVPAKINPLEQGEARALDGRLQGLLLDAP